MDTLILWCQVKLKSRRVFLLEDWSYYFLLAGKLLIPGLIVVLYNNSVLGLYSRCNEFLNMILNNINVSIQSVLLPALLEMQEDKFKLKLMGKGSIKISSF